MARAQTFSEIANVGHCGLASVIIIEFIMSYMELFVPKLDQHAPCFAISEKACCTGKDVDSIPAGGSILDEFI